jgi:hypothetical protein
VGVRQQADVVAGGQHGVSKSPTACGHVGERASMRQKVQMLKAVSGLPVVRGFEGACRGIAQVGFPVRPRLQSGIVDKTLIISNTLASRLPPKLALPGAAQDPSQ